jgi:hypothetical protein
MDDRPRKDRLIQTRVPQDLESTLKDEARKRRLSVSHLIRNVLEDTFSLVDNVVSEVDRVVHDSVGVAQALRRDARRLAATARGETAHRQRGARGDGPAESEAEADDGEDGQLEEPGEAPEQPAPEANETSSDRPKTMNTGALADVYGFQELVLNQSVECASCGTPIPRGARAYLGMSDKPGTARVWVCQDCLDIISE